MKMIQLFLRGLLLAVLMTWAGMCLAAPQQLLDAPLESPEEEYAANVEWDAAGFMGRLRMQIYTRGSKPTTVIELPQIKPAPANLMWINNDWVACESFVAEEGAAFFYVNVPKKRGYLIEIFAPDKDGDWLVSYTTNDSVSSASIHTISQGHSSLFPILLRDLPREGLPYLSPDFTYLLADAVDAFVEWRKNQKFEDMSFISEMAQNDKTGRIVLASVDETAELIYFPQGTTTTREMLALTQRQKLPESIQKIISGIDPPELSLKWNGDEGDFQVLATRHTQDSTTTTELLVGRLEGVSDSVYKGPGVADLVGSGSKGSGSSGSSGSGSSSKSSSSGSGSSGSSDKKSPSRSR